MGGLGVDLSLISVHLVHHPQNLLVVIVHLEKENTQHVVRAFYWAVE